MPRFDVLCVGSATFDTIATTSSFPSEDTRVEAREVISAGGGPAATAAVALARLGVSVAFAGAVADDDIGRRIRADLDAEGVDTRWMMTHASHSGASVVVVSGDGARTIVTRPAPAPVWIPSDAAEWVHADQTGYSAVVAARSAGLSARISIDAGNPVEDLGLAGIDLYAPTVTALLARFPSADVPTAARQAHAEGADAVVATSGADGAYFSDASSSGRIPAVPIEPLSTLGAGDVFHGALLAGIIGGADLGQAVEGAAWVAAMSCAALDGRSAIPRRGAFAARFPELARDPSSHLRGEGAGTRS